MSLLSDPPRARSRSATARRWLMAAALLTMLGTASCGSPDSTSSGRLSVTTSFYPLTYLTDQIGGDRVDVTTMTKPGAEPHDLEVTPRDVAGLRESDLVVYLAGFQPAVDDAVSTARPKTTFDAADPAGLDLTYTPIEEGIEAKDERGTDPHFWLDPIRLSTVAADLTQTLITIDPDGRQVFEANLTGLRAELAGLDEDFRSGLARCATTDVVTSHNAFAYLTRRYGLEQIGISGLVPEAEPGAQRLAAVARLVRERGVSTIYYESLVDPAAARTVARETGARTDVLDPIEGLTDSSRGRDYLEVMRSNLTSLRKGQSCR